MNSSCKLLFVIVLVMINTYRANSTPLENYRNEKKSLHDFGLMVECETNRDKWSYNGYGCWCGYGGAGKPLDAVDRCCSAHDKCYDAVMAGNECTTSGDPYLVSYKTENCSDCAPASEYNTWEWLGWVTIKCRRAICHCDSIAAKCFASNVYNHTLANYDKSKCGQDTLA